MDDRGINDLYRKNIEKVDWNRLEYRIIGLYHHPVHPSARRLRSLIPHYVCWRLDAGELRLHPRGETPLVVTAGHWVLIPPDLPREHIFSRDNRLWSLHVWIGWSGHRPLYRLPGILVRPVEAWSRLGRASASLVAHCAERERRSLEEFAAAEQARWRWLEAFHRCLRAEGCPIEPRAHRDERIPRALALLETLDHVARLPYERLRTVTGLSRVHLDRLFVAHLGKTPRRVLDEMLFRRVTERLAATDRPLKGVAGEFGFPSPAHFNRWFKRLAGQTPGHYRRRIL